MKYRQCLIISQVLFVLSACTWQRIPEAPAPAKENAIPLRVGINGGTDTGSRTFVPGVVRELRAMRLFDAIDFPYHEGDTVDAVATVSVDGDWQPSGAGPIVAVGVSLGLASPFVGPSVTGTHIIKAALISGTEDVGFYSAKVTTKGEWGVMADANEASQRTHALQIKRLADALASAIREDRSQLLAKVNANGSEYPVAEVSEPARPLRTPRRTPAPAPVEPSNPPVKAQAPQPQLLRQGPFSFEAEKLALQQGCTTSTGIRPVALLVNESEAGGLYTVACINGSLSIRCEHQICELEQAP